MDVPIKYMVVEMQTMADGSVSHLEWVFDTLAEAESKYHGVLSFAAISQLPLHTATLTTTEGALIASQAYHHVIPEPEPETPTEPENNDDILDDGE